MQPTNLFQYFQQQGKPLPSVLERSTLYEQQGLGRAVDYRGTEQQNIAFLGALTKPSTSTTPSPITSSQGSPLATATAIQNQTTPKAPNDPSNQFNTATGQPNPDYKPTTLGTPPIPAPSVVGTSTQPRADARRAELLAQIEANKPPTLPGTTPQETTARGDVATINNELTNIANESMILEDEFAKFKSKAGEGVSELGRQGAVSEEQRNLQFRRDALSRRELVATTKLSNRQAVLRDIQQTTRQNYADAVNQYDKDYARALKLYDIYEDEADELRVSANASADTIIKNIKDFPDSFSSPTPTQQARWSEIELQAGLPPGHIKSMAQFASQSIGWEKGATVGNDTVGWVTTFVNPKTQEVKSVRVMRGTGGGGGVLQNTEYTGVINTILASGKFTKDQSNAIRTAINSGEDPFTVIKNNAKNIMGSALATDLDKAETAKFQLGRVNDTIKAYYAGGGKTNIFSGNYENVLNKLGKVSDPLRVELATEVAIAMQAYRLAVTGMAASIQEDARIDKVFPGITKGEILNSAVMKATMKSFEDKVDSSYRNTLGSAYDKLKSAEASSQVSQTPVAPPAFISDADMPNFEKQATGKEIIKSGETIATQPSEFFKRFLNIFGL